MTNKIIKCPNCQYVMFNMETFEALGHSADYWIDLQANAEQHKTVDFIMEIAKLKSRLYDAQRLTREMIDKLEAE